MTEFKLALDWTPNINHIGFIVGKEKGFYENYNILKLYESLIYLRPSYTSLKGPQLKPVIISFIGQPT